MSNDINQYGQERTNSQDPGADQTGVNPGEIS